MKPKSGQIFEIWQLMKSYRFTDRTIVEKTGYTGEKIMNMIKELFHYTGIAIRKEYWDSYDDMNQKILQKIG